MKEYKILVWKAVDKFDNPSRSIYGERLRMVFRKPTGRRNFRLELRRDFKSYFDWKQVDENGFFAITLNRSVMDQMIEILVEMRRELHGE
jgi:hypothetical protein